MISNGLPEYTQKKVLSNTSVAVVAKQHLTLLLGVSSYINPYFILDSNIVFILRGRMLKKSETKMRPRPK